jgi:hypothetical protein
MNEPRTKWGWMFDKDCYVGPRATDAVVGSIQAMYGRIRQLESELASLRDQLADFRDAVLHERGALAESGMTNEQINAVLSEFDDRFVPYDQERAG